MTVIEILAAEVQSGSLTFSAAARRLHELSEMPLVKACRTIHKAMS